MEKAYIIIVGSGEYSDRRESPIRVFLDMDAAQASMKMLEGIWGKHFPVRRIPNEDWNETWKRRRVAAAAAKADYEAAGYDVYDGEVDWELSEAPLVR